MKETLKATVTLKISYDTPQDRRDCLKDVRAELRRGIGRGSYAGSYSWDLTTGSVDDIAISVK